MSEERFRPGLLRRTLGSGSPGIPLDEDDHAALRERCRTEVSGQLAEGAGDRHLPELVAQASDDYQEQDRRSDRAERRASSIQAAVATLLGLTTAAGGLLINSGASKHLVHRLGVTAVFVFIVITLIVTAIRALAVQAVQHEWVRPNAARYLTDRARLEEDFQLEMLATWMAAARHNARIADWKYHELQRTARTFRVALVALVMVPVTLLVVNLVRGG